MEALSALLAAAFVALSTVVLVRDADHETPGRRRSVDARAASVRPTDQR